MSEPSIVVDRIKAVSLSVPIRGLTPLIMHAWSAKAKQQMLDGFQQKKKQKVAKDPQADYEAAFYRMAAPGGSDRYGFPVLAFKAATVAAARFYDKSVPMVMLKQALLFTGEISDASDQPLTEITGEPKMREDVVRLGMSTDLRYRPEFAEWSATLHVTYMTSVLGQSSVISLIDAGGLAVGVGEWRPQRGGMNGTFEIDPTREIEVLS